MRFTRDLEYAQCTKRLPIAAGHEIRDPRTLRARVGRRNGSYDKPRGSAQLLVAVICVAIFLVSVIVTFSPARSADAAML